MALIRVPAWPMPIQKTKLVMSQAQPTGLLLPQTPMPVKTVCRNAKTNSPASSPVHEIASHQRRVGKDSSGRLMSSSSLRKSTSPSTKGAASSAGAAASALCDVIAAPRAAPAPPPH